MEFTEFTNFCISYFSNKKIPTKFNEDVITYLLDIRAFEFSEEYRSFKEPKMEKMTFTKKEKVSQSQSNLNTGHLVLAEKIDSFMKSAKTKRDHEIINKLKIELTKGFGNLEINYEQLSPYDKIEIMENLKKFINPCFHDFYNSFIPLEIMYELENKNMNVFCQFNKGCKCNDCNCKCTLKDSVCFNIKIPINNYVSFINDTHSNSELSIKTDTQKTESNYNLQLLTKRMLFLNWYSLNYANDFYRVTANVPLLIHIFMSSKKKLLDWLPISNNKQKRLGPKETNSAYCANSGDHTKIVLYRSEEINKLSIHEFMHGLSIEGDYEWSTNKQMNEKINSTINIDHYCSSSGCTRVDSFNEQFISGMSEGYVDFCADIVNMIIGVTENYRDGKKQFEIGLRKFMFYELNFSLFQVAKILVYFKFNTYGELFINNNNKNKQIYQSTNVFSYFVIRAILLFNLVQFLTELKKYSHNSFLGLFSLRTEQKAKTVHKFIINKLTDEKFTQAINDYILFIKNTNIPEPLKSTMRRSVIEY